MKLRANSEIYFYCDFNYLYINLEKVPYFDNPLPNNQELDQLKSQKC